VKKPNPITLDPLIHEAARLAILAVLKECDSASFTFLAATTALTRGNLSTHLAKLVAADYVHEEKQIADRKPLSTYKLTATGRAAFLKYQRDWKLLTGMK
jgi:DNA-binding MarR family transcriptional regulator